MLDNNFSHFLHLESKKRAMDIQQHNRKKTEPLDSEQFYPEEMRCCCGKLLAKQTKTGIVIRCSRCKQEIKIDLSRVTGDYTPV